jgi:hypothetical protein
VAVKGSCLAGGHLVGDLSRALTKSVPMVTSRALPTIPATMACNQEEGQGLERPGPHCHRPQATRDA